MIAVPHFFGGVPRIMSIPASLDATRDKERTEICAFLQNLGKELRVPQASIASAIVFFHRFYTCYTFEEQKPQGVGCACLFLAGKVEESPIRLKDLIGVMYKAKYGKPIRLESPEFKFWREEILQKERVILQTLGFDFQIEHPYSDMLKKVKQLEYDNQNKLAQLAWNFINDSLRTTLCIQYNVKEIASTSIYLASQYLQSSNCIKGVNGTDWREVLDCPVETIEKISNQILDLYDKPQEQTKEEKTDSDLKETPMDVAE